MPALATLLFGVVRLPELTRSPLWFDELFSIGVAGLPAGDSLRRIVADHTNPPLFYLLLKGWMALGGEGDRWVRLLPCLLAMLLGAALVWLAREVRAGAVAGTLAVMLAAASPLSVDLANEVRAYSLLALLACLSLAAVLRDRRLHTRESFALLTFVNIALVHAHYFGWFTVGAELAAAAVFWSRTDARREARCAIFTLLAFLPWAATVASHALGNPAPLRNVAWIAPPGPGAPLWLLRDFTGRWSSATADQVWLAFACLALCALALRVWRSRGAVGGGEQASSPEGVGRRGDSRSPNASSVLLGTGTDREALLMLATAGLAVPVAIWALSLLSGHSLWVQRYLVGSAAPVALLTAVAVATLPPRRWALAAVAGFVWAAVAFAAVPGRAPTKFDWRRFARRIDVAVGSPRDVFALEAFTAAPLQRYAGAGMRVQVVDALEALPRGASWLVFRRESFTAGLPVEALHALGFRVVASLSAETAGQKIIALRLDR